jgi:hypothetical protein
MLFLSHCWHCPRTVEAAAADFADWLGPRARESIRVHRPGEPPTCALFDHARMAGRRYGLLCRVAAVRPADEEWVSGWNHRLIRDGGTEAQWAARRIVAGAYELVHSVSDPATG